MSACRVHVLFPFLWLRMVKRGARQEPKEDQSRNQNEDADQVGWGDPATKVVLVLGIITPEHLDERAHDGIADEVSGKDLPIKFLAAEHPGQCAVKDKIQH